MMAACLNEPRTVLANKSESATCPFEESLQEGYSHGVHCMIFSPWSKLVFGRFDPKAAILMHLRFDGHLGFPGGKVDENINCLNVEQAKKKAVEAMVRELEEEMNMDTAQINVSWDNYRLTYIHPTKNYFLHFFCIQINFDEFEQLEFAAMKSGEFGNEVMGNFRVPLYTMEDGYRGFPAFLNNRFIGTAKEELLQMCVTLGILTEDYVKNTVESAKLGLLLRDSLNAEGRSQFL